MKGGSKKIWFSLSQWLKDAPERAIDDAYKAAVVIKKLEDDFFEGNPVSKEWGYAPNTYSLFQTQLQNALFAINFRLVEYKISSRIPNLLKPDITSGAMVALKLDTENDSVKNDFAQTEFKTQPNILQKLAFIDLVLARYKSTSFSSKLAPLSSLNNTSNSGTDAVIEVIPGETPKRNFRKAVNKSPKTSKTAKTSPNSPTKNNYNFTPKYVEQTHVPISILQYLERIRRNLISGDHYEQELMQEVRQTRWRIETGIKFIVILIVVTLFTQQISKNFIYAPIIKAWAHDHKIEISERVQERALNKFREEKEKIEFEFLLGRKIFAIEPESKPESKSESVSQSKPEAKPVLNLKSPEIIDVPSPDLKIFDKSQEDELKRILAEKAREINSFSQDLNLEGIQNLFADITAGIVVYGVLIAGKKELGVIKHFLDETLHSLNDNAKAFLIIVITDTFVGYHSSDGWEALIDTISNHFGIPESRDLTLTFIAIVPVFLDALLKFWVFQTLTKSSPSTATIYGEMNK